MDREDAGQAVAAPPPVLGCCAKSGACDVDARQAVAAPPPMLGPGSLLVRSRGLRGQGGRRTGGGSPTARAGSLREIGGLRGCGRKAVAAPPPVLGRCSRNRGLAWTWTQDRWWQPHRPCWVIAREIGGPIWTWQPHRPRWVVAREIGGLAVTTVVRVLRFS